MAGIAMLTGRRVDDEMISITICEPSVLYQFGVRVIRTVRDERTLTTVGLHVGISVIPDPL